MPKITAMIGGQESVFDCDSSNTILEAALDEGVPAPFSCMAGACHVCMATVDSGEVDRGDDSYLDDSEKAAGYILTCQSKPKTDDVKITYKES